MFAITTKVITLIIYHKKILNARKNTYFFYFFLYLPIFYFFSSLFFFSKSAFLRAITVLHFSLPHLMPSAVVIITPPQVSHFSPLGIPEKVVRHLGYLSHAQNNAPLLLPLPLVVSTISPSPQTGQITPVLTTSFLGAFLMYLQ